MDYAIPSIDVATYLTAFYVASAAMDVASAACAKTNIRNAI
jgi:hypothetical protein